VKISQKWRHRVELPRRKDVSDVGGKVTLT